MHLLLIRHGESVDNVAGLYGGSRDAALTAHGLLQARRLASSLVESNLQVKHVFSSNLGRAVRTASTICDAQNKAHRSALAVLELTELREKHFGNWEGVRFATGAAEQRPTQMGAETSESLKARTNAFLEGHLAPVLTSSSAVDSEKSCVVIVSHGICLGVLTLALVKKLNTHGARMHPSLAQLTSTRISWSNTGYVDLAISTSNAKAMDVGPAGSSPWSGLEVKVLQVNCTAHLQGLRKTRGGIGSAAHDDKQKTLEGFFVPSSRKRKADEVAS